MTVSRVLVVEDSPTMARMMRGWIEATPNLEVAGLASTGEEALRLVAELHPDVISMDVQLPDMDGIEVTRRVLESHAVPVVVVSASVDGPAGRTAMSALAEGAVAAVPKPDLQDDKEIAALMRTLRTMAGITVRARTPRKDTGRHVQPSAARPRIVCVGVSTGGPQVLQEVLRSLPPISAPVVVVQHIAAVFSRTLAEWLTSTTPKTVAEVAGGESLNADRVYVARPGSQLLIRSKGSVLRAQEGTSEPRGGFCPSVDVTFESVAESCGAQAVGVLLTGMGRDGVAGCGTLHEVGAQVIAQDPLTCTVPGMPLAAIEAGVVDRILRPEEISRCLGSRLGSDWSV